MPDLADLYPGFASHWIDTSAGKLFARAGGNGPPLMLLHGYAQTHVMWHKVAFELAQRFTLVIPDLPGYGWSAVPAAGRGHAPYTKRAMALAMIDLMEALGYLQFNLAGHDRGGRVAYRLALDHPGRLTKLATLDIVPTFAMWHDIDARLAYRIWHWTFLALPAPGPEQVIGRDPVAFWDWKTAPGTKAKSLAPFDARALDHYRTFFSDPSRIHATCEDYRAGRTSDLADDEADWAADRKITCPMLALWGDSGIPSDTRNPLDTWGQWARDVQGFAIDSGHYLPEENPGATATALLDFFAS
ncbi:MAG: alpha/beta hydrolase [Bradyrhizobiaceae bacterium]|nr:alpha/beta hydrolase [Bradyrhizobiaceae bacterium]